MDSTAIKPPSAVTIIVYVQGMAAMLPWNFFITADTFWQYKLRNVTLDNVSYSSNDTTYTPLQLAFMPTLGIIANLFCFLFLAATSWFVTRVSERMRIVSSLVVMLLVMVTITVLAVVNTDAWQTTFYVTVMVMVAVINTFEAVFQGSLYGVVGSLPSACTNALVSGMAIAGVFSSMARIVSLLLGEENPVKSGIIYFIIADVFIIMAMMLYIAMRKMDYYRDSKTASQNKMTTKTVPKSLQAYWIVFKKVWWHSFTLGLSLFITLSVFPAVQVYVTSTTPDGPWKDVYFQPTITFLLFNIGDVMGRELPRWIQWPGPDGWQLPTMGAGRFLLVAAIMLCHGYDKTFPTLFTNDAWYIVFNMLFGITNGYFGCLPLIYYPQKVSPEEVELAGTIMGAVMGAGMVLGSGVSPAMVALWGPNS